MQQLLDQSKGAQEAADPAAEQEAVEQQDAENIIGEPGTGICQGILQRAQGQAAAAPGQE